MPLSRRRFLTGSAAATAGALAWPEALLEAGETTVSPLKLLRGSVYVFTGPGGTIGYLDGEARVVVDSQYPEGAATFLESLGDLDSPIDLLINTHHHADHTAGDATLRRAVRKIVAHENVPDLMRAARQRNADSPEPVVFDQLFATDFKHEAGKVVVTGRHYGPAHTGGDVVVHFPGPNVAHMGDLVFNRWHPFIDRPGGASVRGWISTLEKALADLDSETLFIFGHGAEAFGVTGTAADVRLQRDYLSAVLERARKGKAEGKTAEALAGDGVLPGFEEYGSPGKIATLTASLRAALEELQE